MRVPDEIAGERPKPWFGRGPRQDHQAARRRPAVRRAVHAGPGATLWFAGGLRHDPDLDAAVFATQRATRKYRLLSECAHVALVVDNRSALPGRLMDVEAVTATGRAHEVATGPAFDQWSGCSSTGTLTSTRSSDPRPAVSSGSTSFGTSMSPVSRRSGSGFPSLLDSALAKAVGAGDGLVGGKAARLGSLIEAGFRFPEDSASRRRRTSSSSPRPA